MSRADRAFSCPRAGSPSLAAKAAAGKRKSIRVVTDAAPPLRWAPANERSDVMAINNEEARTVPVNGIEMHVQVTGAGDPLLLLHGFTGCGDDWRHVFRLDELGQRYQVIRPDARGHGRSTNPAGNFTHAQCARDLATLLDALGVD